MVEPTEGGTTGPIFKWHPMADLGPHEFPYEGGTVQGRLFEVELTSGVKVHVWRADSGQHYFCHGLAFGGREAPGGPVSPLGEYVPAILRGHYEPVAEAEAVAGDILVWRGKSADDVTHSATLTHPVTATGAQYLDDATRLQTKNGILPETNTTLGKLIDRYGEAYNTYRRRTQQLRTESGQ
jgi:hypothetical protein